MPEGYRYRWLARLRQVAKDLCATVDLIRMKVIHLAQLQCNTGQVDHHPQASEYFIHVVAIDGNWTPSRKFGMEPAIGPSAKIPKNQNPE